MMGFCEYEKHTGTGLAVLIRSLLWRRKKNEKKRYSLTFSSVEKEAKRHSPHQGHIFLTTIQPSCLYSLTFFDRKKEAKKYSPHQGHIFLTTIQPSLPKEGFNPNPKPLCPLQDRGLTVNRGHRRFTDVLVWLSSFRPEG